MRKYVIPIFMLIIFCAIVFVKDISTRKNEKNAISELTQLLVIPMWQMDSEAIQYYLKLSIQNDYYNKIVVKDLDKRIIAQTESNKRSFLGTVRMIDQKITYHGEELGVLIIHYINYNNMFYLIVALILGAMYLFKLVYSRQLDMKLLLKQSFEYNPSIMGILDYETRAIIDANRSFLSTLGYKSKKEIIGKTLKELQLFRKGLKIESIDVVTKQSKKEEIVVTVNGEEVTLLYSLAKVEQANKLLIVITAIDITHKKESERSLAEMNKQLIESARIAGQAEIATGILHNVGNLLNSVGISASLIEKSIVSKPSRYLFKAINLFKDGKVEGSIDKIIMYIEKVAESFNKQENLDQQEVSNLIDNLNHIIEIVQLHQSYSSSKPILEETSVDEIIQDAIRINQAGLERDGVSIKYHPSLKKMMRLDRHRILQILISLIRNAKDATVEKGSGDRVITIDSSLADKRLVIQVQDNGIGIEKSMLAEIFSYGFTTREEGHGFGLHSCANIVGELGGQIVVNSDGVGQGAQFMINIPVSSS